MEKVIFKFPNYLRKVTLSQKRRAVYYIYDGNKLEGEKGKKLPAKFLNEAGKEFLGIHNAYPSPIYNYLADDVTVSTIKRGKKKLVVLVDAKTKEPILCNPRAAGTPNEKPINGQALYNGTMQTFMRAKMMAQIKEYFWKEIDYIQKGDNDPFASSANINAIGKLREYRNETLIMFIFLYDHVDQENWDLGNRLLPYEKAFPDLLTTGMIDQKTKVIHDPPLIDDNIKYIKGICNFFIPIEEYEIPTLKFIFKPIKDFKAYAKDLENLI